jgi:hypothetical protein
VAPPIEEDKMSAQVRDFDQEYAQRPLEQFRAGGEQFSIRLSVRPEVLLSWAEFDEESADAMETLAVVDKLMTQLLVPEDAEKWAAVRAKEGDGEVGLAMMVEILQYAIAAVSGRPTSALSSSGPGRSDTGTPSTDDSPQRGLISVPSTSDDSST